MTTNDSKSINGTCHQIKVINKQSFFIEDTRGYSEFIRNGTVKIVKVPIKTVFKPLEEVLSLEELKPPFDEMMS